MRALKKSHPKSFSARKMIVILAHLTRMQLRARFLTSMVSRRLAANKYNYIINSLWNYINYYSVEPTGGCEGYLLVFDFEEKCHKIFSSARPLPKISEAAFNEFWWMRASVEPTNENGRVNVTQRKCASDILRINSTNFIH